MTGRSDVVVIILAGGLGTRLGGGKGLQQIGAVRLVDRVIARLRPQADTLILNADDAMHSDVSIPVVRDVFPGKSGPLVGVLTGLDWMRHHAPDARYLVTAPVDCPFLPLDLVDRLTRVRDADQADGAVAASGGHRHPVTALWPVAMFEALQQAITIDDLRRVTSFTARYRMAEAAFAVLPIDPFFNVNTPDDLAEAQRLALLLDAAD